MNIARMRRGSLITIAAVAVLAIAVSVVFAILAINRAGVFAQRIDDNCEPFVVIAFRGSGEPNLTPGVTNNEGQDFRYGDSELVTNGWESITLTHLFDELSRTTVEDFRADSIPVVPVGPAGTEEPFGYDAIMAVLEASSISSALSYPNSKLLYSATRGAEAATQLIQDYRLASEGCPVEPKFAVVGYSQGAMAARHTAELNPESVVAVLNIGDPYQKPDAPGVREKGASGVGIIRWKTDEEQANELDQFYDAVEFNSSICHADDPICQFSPVKSLVKLATGNYDTHMDYYTDAYPGEAEEDAGVIAQLGYEYRLRALEAAEAGEVVSWDSASLTDIQLRGLSLSFPGTPTLVSAASPAHTGKNLTYEFDLDGDGVFETESETGLVWVTFTEDGPQQISARVTDQSGTVHEATTSIRVAPIGDAETPLESPATVIPVNAEPEHEQEPRIPVAATPVTTPGASVNPAPAQPSPTLPSLTPPTPAPPAPAPPSPVHPAPEPPTTEEPTGEEEPPATEESGEDEPPTQEDPPETEEPVEEEPVDDSPSIVFVGDELTSGNEVIVQGSGFPPGYVFLSSQELEIFSEAFVDESGVMESWFWIPADALPGNYVLTFTSEGEPTRGPWEFVLTVGG